MKKVKVIFTLFIVILLSYLLESNVIAQGENILLRTNKQKVKIGEEFNIFIQTQNVEIAACNIKIYFEKDKVELISSPENSNIIDNTILYTWFDKQGGVNVNENEVLAQFQFKAKENGIATFNIQGEFYNKQEQNISIDIQPLEIIIGEQLDEIDAQILQESSPKEQSNSNLAILRLEQEGITPVFENHIKEYYLTIGEAIKSLKITAIPENENSKIEIEGNENLKMGMNIISIKVSSQDQKNQTEYKIFVTKTDDKEKANANLENLAIENVTLTPEFENQTTNYEITVENNLENLNILAIPENEKAHVKVEGEKDLKVGENLVNITVTAPNNISLKKYVIKVKRESIEETQANKKQEETNQLEQNNMQIDGNMQEKDVIDNSKEIQNVEKQNQEKEAKNALGIVATVIMILIVIGTVIMIKKKRNKR